MSPDLLIIKPELLLSIGGLLLLVLPWIKSARVLNFATLGLLAGAFNLKLGALLVYAEPVVGFDAMLVKDQFGGFLELIILAASILVVLMALGSTVEEVKSRREFYVLVLFATVGLMFVTASTHFALIYLGLELVSVLSYLLIGFAKRDDLSIEGALKYFLFGALSTGVMLYGLSLLYGLTGALDLAALKTAIPAALEAAPLLTAASILLTFVGLGFKLSLVPFHLWAPDAYEAGPTPAVTYISLAPKLAGFALLIRLFVLDWPATELTATLLGAVAILTMTFGNLAALWQTNVKRLLAYSSIAHAGTMLVGVVVGTPLGLTALLYYLMAYVLMNAAAFAAVMLVKQQTGREDLDAFAGLARRAPLLGFLTLAAFLSLGGVPPLAGFFGKMWILAAALKADAPILALVTAINSVIAFFYYMRVVKAMYLDAAPGQVQAQRSTSLVVTLSLCVIGLFVMGLLQAPWLVMASDAVPMLIGPDAMPWSPVHQ